jgi:hypothetical protein
VISRHRFSTKPQLGTTFGGNESNVGHVELFRSSAPNYTQGRQLFRCRQHGEAGSSAFPDKRHGLASGRNIAGNMLQVGAIIEVQRKLCSRVIWQTDRDRSPASAIGLNDPRKQYCRDRTR